MKAKLIIEQTIIRYSIPLPPYSYIYVTHASRALQSHDLSAEGVSCGSDTQFLTIQGHGPPQMYDQLNAEAISEKTRTLMTIHIIHSHIHSNKAHMGRMIMMTK